MTVRAKLATIFLVLIALPTALAVVLLFIDIRGVVKKVRALQLEGVADLETKKVEAFLLERKGDAEIFQTYPLVKDNLPILVKHAGDRNNPSYLSAKRRLEYRLSTIVKVYGYSDVMLAGPDGMVVAVGNEAHIKEHLGRPLSRDAFEAGRKGVYFSDIYRSEVDGRYAMLCTAPLTDNRGGFIGEVAFEIDAGRLFDAIRDATGLGETGETFIGVMRADDVLFINPFHPERNEVRNKAAFWGGKTALPMQSALKGMSGSGESIDYMGHPIIAAWRQVPSTGWGLVAKIDSSEALAPVVKAGWLALGLELFILLACTVAALLISRSITEPIRAVQMGAEIIGSGDLDYKVGTSAKDEVGQLSRAIDRMAENLKKTTASRDDLDREVEARKRSEEVLRASLRLSEYGLTHTLDELLTKTLDEAEALTGSRIGFFHFVEADQKTLRLQTWSTNTLGSMCTAEGKGTHYPVDKAGVWADAVIQRVPVVHNDYAALPRKKGLPPGHAPVVRELVVPILRSGRIMGVVGVGNKPGEYGEDDMDAVLQLANRAWDIILAKRAEEEVKKLNEELERRVAERTAQLTESNKELEAFSYSVSHDLRAPLRHIQGFVELLAKQAGDTLDEKGRRYLYTITISTSQMGNLIDDLLSFSRMGRSEMHKTAVSLGRLVEKVIDDLRDETAGRAITWKVGDLPMVYADPAMLGLALVNLVSNALKFTAKTEKAVIEIGSYEDGQENVFYIRDNGAGFEMQYVDKLFGVFQRLHRAEEFAGTGIGLANVRRIITRHGGRTWAEGSPGGGAVFCFSLPKQVKGE